MAPLRRPPLPAEAARPRPREVGLAEGSTDRRVIAVTGAASGIGRALCERLAGPDTALVIHTGQNRAGLALRQERPFLLARSQDALGYALDQLNRAGVTSFVDPDTAHGVGPDVVSTDRALVWWRKRWRARPRHP